MNLKKVSINIAITTRCNGHASLESNQEEPKSKQSIKVLLLREKLIAANMHTQQRAIKLNLTYSLGSLCRIVLLTKNFTDCGFHIFNIAILKDLQFNRTKSLVSNERRRGGGGGIPCYCCCSLKEE